MAEDFFGNLSKTLKKTVDTVGKKTDEFVEIQKIRTRQHALEDQIEKNYQDIGLINLQPLSERRSIRRESCRHLQRYHRSGKRDCRLQGRRGKQERPHRMPGLRRKCSERCSFLHALRCCYAGEGRRAGGCRVCTRRTGRKSRRNRSSSAGRRA